MVDWHPPTLMPMGPSSSPKYTSAPPTEKLYFNSCVHCKFCSHTHGCKKLEEHGERDEKEWNKEPGSSKPPSRPVMKFVFKSLLWDDLTHQYGGILGNFPNSPYLTKNMQYNFFWIENDLPSTWQISKKSSILVDDDVSKALNKGTCWVKAFETCLQMFPFPPPKSFQISWHSLLHRPAQ